MSDIELIIKMPEEDYKAIVENYDTFPSEMKRWGLYAIKNGRTIPEGHRYLDPEKGNGTDAPAIVNTDKDADIANVFVYVDWSSFRSIQIGDTKYTKGIIHDGMDDTFNGKNVKAIAIPGGTKIVATSARGDRNWYCRVDGNCGQIGNSSSDHATFTVPTNVWGMGSLDFDDCYSGKSNGYGVYFYGEWCSGWSIDDLNPSL